MLDKSYWDHPKVPKTCLLAGGRGEKASKTEVKTCHFLSFICVDPSYLAPTIKGFAGFQEIPGFLQERPTSVRNISPGNDKNRSHYCWPLISLLLGQEFCCTSGVEEVMGAPPEWKVIGSHLGFRVLDLKMYMEHWRGKYMKIQPDISEVHFGCPHDCTARYSKYFYI